jgi:hypothetical protein
LRGLVLCLGALAGGREQLVAGQPAVEGRPASPEAEAGQFGEQDAALQVRVIGEPLAAVVSEGAREQVQAGGRPAARGPLPVEVGPDGGPAVAEPPGDLAGRQPVLVQGDGLLGMVSGQRRRHLVAGGGDWEVMSASTAPRAFLVIFSVPSRTALMAALRISQSRLMPLTGCGSSANSVVLVTLGAA